MLRAGFHIELLHLMKKQAMNEPHILINSSLLASKPFLLLCLVQVRLSLSHSPTPALNLQLPSIEEANTRAELTLKFNDNDQTFNSCFLVKVEVRPPPLFQVFGIGEHLEHGQVEDVFSRVESMTKPSAELPPCRETNLF